MVLKQEKRSKYMCKCDFCEYSYFNNSGNRVCWLAGSTQERRGDHCINAIEEMKETFKKGNEKDAR